MIRVLLLSVALAAAPAIAQPVIDGPLAEVSAETPLRLRAERCGGVVILAMSQSATPVLQNALQTLAFTAMGEGGKSEDVQTAMIAWAEAYVAPDAAPRTRAFFAEDRALCLALAGALGAE